MLRRHRRRLHVGGIRLQRFGSALAAAGLP
jgi:hypothetical protein